MRISLTRIKLNGRTTAPADEHAIDSALAWIRGYQLSATDGSEIQGLAVPPQQPQLTKVQSTKPLTF